MQDDEKNEFNETIKVLRKRKFEIMQYLDNWDYKKALDWLYRLRCEYIAVLHDKDKNENGDLKRRHIHIFVNCKDAQDFPKIAKMCDLQEQYISTIKKKWSYALAYAFHLTKEARAQNKHEYDSSALISAKGITYDEIKEMSLNYDKQIDHDAILQQDLFAYGNCEITKAELISKMDARDYNKFGNVFKRMAEYRQMKVRNRDMQVVYICGVSGSGKTTLAKYMAHCLKYDYFVSGSGKDLLDGYDKEECIILDDLRADIFTKAELFKLTDNNTNSSVKSRFKNKDISYCKLMIITSIKTPHDLYNWETLSMENKDENFKQFSRRIGEHFLYIDANGNIIDKKYDVSGVNSKITCKLWPYSMTQVFAILGIRKQVGNELFDALFNKIKDDLDKNQNEALQDEDLPF